MFYYILCYIVHLVIYILHKCNVFIFFFSFTDFLLLKNVYRHTVPTTEMLRGVNTRIN